MRFNTCADASKIYDDWNENYSLICGIQNGLIDGSSYGVHPQDSTSIIFGDRFNTLLRFNDHSFLQRRFQDICVSIGK